MTPTLAPVADADFEAMLALRIEALRGAGLAQQRRGQRIRVHAIRLAHATTVLRICSSTSFALAGIGVPGP